MVQIGGSDQLGNITTGYELVTRMDRDAEAFGITLPLIKSETGEKLGKSAGAPVWLSPEKTSYFDFFQYFVRVPDSDVERLLKLFTFMPLGDIEALMAKHRKAPEKRLAQEKLAEKVTLLVHGEEGLDVALKATSVLYKNNLETLADLSLDEYREVQKTNVE